MSNLSLNPLHLDVIDAFKKIPDFFTRPSGKRKHNDLTSQYNPGGYIPQQDGAMDATHGVFEIEVFFYSLLVSIIYISRMSAYLLVNC